MDGWKDRYINRERISKNKAACYRSGSNSNNSAISSATAEIARDADVGAHNLL